MRLLYTLFALLSAGCSTTHSYEVSQHGGMRDTLRMGKTQPRISFAEVASKPHAYAVGALANLDGEITIFDGTVYTATTQDGTTAITAVADDTYDAATLLTLAHVESWQNCILPSNHPLEKAIELAAIIQGIDTETPFPFLITGSTNDFQMHVINGFCPVANPNLAAKFQPWRLVGSQSTPITVVGFYAKNKEGVMTHHGSNLHIHGVIDQNGTITTGHLDSIEINSDATLFLPIV